MIHWIKRIHTKLRNNEVFPLEISRMDTKLVIRFNLMYSICDENAVYLEGLFIRLNKNFDGLPLLLLEQMFDLTPVRWCVHNNRSYDLLSFGLKWVKFCF